MKRAISALVALAASVSAMCGQTTSVVRGAMKVDFVECPKCEMCARFSPDGSYATINNSRLRDGDPDPAEFAARQSRMLERVFAAMQFVASNKAVACDGFADAWRTNGALARAVLKDDSREALVRDVGAGVVELALYNLSDETRDFAVTLAALGIAGPAEAVDLTERALPPNFEERVVAFVAPKGARIYRLCACAEKPKNANRKHSP